MELHVTLKMHAMYYLPKSRCTGTQRRTPVLNSHKGPLRLLILVGHYFMGRDVQLYYIFYSIGLG